MSGAASLGIGPSERFFGIPRRPEATPDGVADIRGRPLHDLRISVTDRCNFRCVYCMPKEIFGRDHAFLPREELLSFEEITRVARVARVAAELGVSKVRLTGGKPLLRKGLEDLVAMLGAVKNRDGGDLDIALTTNGSAHAHSANALKDAGLKRMTVCSTPWTTPPSNG